MIAFDRAERADQYRDLACTRGYKPACTKR